MTDELRPHIRPLLAIFCDDIRREDNGKNILIGVYSGVIQAPSLPAPVILSTYVPYEKESIGSLPIEFRMLNPDGQPLGYGTTVINLPDDKIDSSAISFPRLSTVLSKPGHITFQIKQYDEPWQDVGQILVRITPPEPG